MLEHDCAGRLSAWRPYDIERVGGQQMQLPSGRRDLSGALGSLARGISQCTPGGYREARHAGWEDIYCIIPDQCGVCLHIHTGEFTVPPLLKPGEPAGGTF